MAVSDIYRNAAGITLLEKIALKQTKNEMNVEIKKENAVRT